MTININQFAQTAQRGELDLQIARSGVLAGSLASTVVGTLKAGDFVKLDAANTTPGTPTFVAAAAGDPTAFILVSTVKASSFVAGDACQVAAWFGPVVYAVAKEEITPGEQLESNADGKMQELNSGAYRAFALDYASGEDQLFRMVLINALSTPL